MNDRPGWTTIPPWLYQNDLPDDELQRVYVVAAERKLAALLAEHPPDREAIGAAQAFLAQARAALARYEAELEMAQVPAMGQRRSLLSPPRLLPAPIVDRPPRCANCRRPIGKEAARPWVLKCRHCKVETRAAD